MAAQAKGVLEHSLARVQDALSAEELQQFIVMILKVGKALQQSNKEEIAVPVKTLHKIQIED